MIEGTTPKEFDVKDFFANKKNMIEAEISKVRIQVVKNKYPTWGLCFNSLEEDQLKTFIGIVDGNVQACNQRINMLNKIQQSDETSFLDSIPQRQYISDDPLKTLSEIGEMDFTQNTTDHLNSPVRSTPASTTNQFGEVVEFDDLMAEPGELELGDQEWVTKKS